MQNETIPTTPPVPTESQALPFSITPHHIAGYDIRIWLVAQVIAAVAIGALFLTIEELHPFLILWLVFPVGIVVSQILFARMSHSRALTLTDTGIEVMTPKETVFIPFEKLQPVKAQITAIGGSAYMSMYIASPELNFKTAFTTLNWGKSDFRRFYAAIPEQYRDPVDNKWQLPSRG